VTRDDASMKMAFYSVDLLDGKPSLLIEDNRRFAQASGGTLWSVDLTDDGQHIIFVSEDAQHPSDAWLADARFQNLRQVTHINPQLERYVFGQSRVIEWDSLDGRRLRGALLLPAGYKEGKRYPLVVHLYGGALLSQYANVFGGFPGSAPFNLQILATREYAILYPDAPLNVGTPMYDLAQTVLPGVNKAIELGIADPDRLGVMGQSFGGYSAL